MATAITHKVLGLTDGEYNSVMHAFETRRAYPYQGDAVAKRTAVSVLYHRESYGKVMALIEFLHMFSLPRGGMTTKTYNKVQDMHNKLEFSWLYYLRDMPKRGPSSSWTENKATRMKAIDDWMIEVIRELWPDDMYLELKVKENRERWASKKMPSGPRKKPGPKPGKPVRKAARTPCSRRTDA